MDKYLFGLIFGAVSAFIWMILAFSIDNDLIYFIVGFPSTWLLSMGGYYWAQAKGE